MRLYLSRRWLVLLYLPCVFFSQAWAEQNMEADPADIDLDESTRAFLEDVKRPSGIKPEAWETILKQYKIKMGRNVSVQFFGRVVDQNMMPIEGARVSGFVRAYDKAYLENLAPGASDKKKYGWTVVTDANGGFTVSGYRGLSLHIEAIEKDGYVAPPYYEYFRLSEKHFGKNIYNAREDQPVVFKMWEKGAEAGSEGLIRQEIKISGPADGREYHIDLVSGSRVVNTQEAFDVSIKVLSASHNAHAGPQYDWSFQLTAPDGGLVSTDDPRSFQAPEEGYASVVVSEHSVSNKKWSRSERRRYYLRSRGGVLHAMIDVTVYAYRDGSSLVRINSVANVGGSRNLMTR